MVAKSYDVQFIKVICPNRKIEQPYFSSTTKEYFIKCVSAVSKRNAIPGKEAWFISTGVTYYKGRLGNLHPINILPG